MDILEKIRQMRLERDWTEYQLAEKSGLTQSTISSWYRKNMQPSIASLEHICNAFNVSLSQFFATSNDYKNKNVDLSDNQIRVLQLFNKLNEKQQSSMLNLLENF